MEKKYCFLISLVLPILFWSGLQAATLEVPGTYATIQAAINAATSGDVINVAAGAYTEAVTIPSTKVLTVNGNNAGTAAGNNPGVRGTETILNGGFRILSSSAINGFSIQNGMQVGSFKYGVSAEADGISVLNCIITTVPAEAGIVTTTGVDNFTLTNSTIQNNYRGIYFNPGSGHILTGNLIDANNGVGVGIGSDGLSNFSMTGNTISNHTLEGWGASAVGANVVAENNSFLNNGVSVAHYGGTAIDASPNYWNGSPSTSGTVTNDPWWSDAAMTILASNMPVKNLTQSLYYSTIQAAIDAATAGDVIEVAAGTYNERVIITKSLTLQGVNEGTTIIDGSTFASAGRGILINNGVTNVTIQNLTVQNFIGSDGNTHGGIYAIGSNNNLTVQHVTIKDNRGTSTSGSGFYANGPIDNVILDHVTSSGHYPGARGIVIWNGLKSNITITNCEVFNNNCCGIELQDGTASGVTFENNLIYNNGDNGIGIVGLQGPGENLIKGNTLTNNGRFGIEVKNPDGSGLTSGAGRIVVENNTVSRNIAITDLRDIAGIAVMRRGVLAGNVDIPSGVVVQNNTVSGYTQSSTSDGFGIVIGGMNHTVSGNTLSGNDVGLQQQAGHLPYPADGDQSNLSDQYFGRDNSPVACGNTISGNNYSGNTADYREVGGPFSSGMITNLTTGTEYCSIQAAIDGATAGDVIEASAGTYNVTSTIVLNKAITVTGPSSGVATVQGTNASVVPVFEISSSNAVLQNLTITHNAIAPGLPNPWLELNNSLVSIPATGTAMTGISILNNKIFTPAQSGAMSTWNAVALTVGTGAVSSINIEGNTVYNTRNGIIIQTGNVATVSNNVIFNTKGGIMNYTSNLTNVNRTMTGNSWTSTVTGIIDHNEWDMVWNTGGTYTSTDWPLWYQTSVLALSHNNNGAYVLDRRGEGTGGNTTGGNRSHIFVNASSLIIAFNNAKGNFNEPFATIALGIQSVVTGGEVYVASGTYAENVAISRAMTLQGANADVPCGSRGAESIIAPASGLPVSITADGVTLNGFEITAPGATYAVNCGNKSNVNVLFNNIHHIGTTLTGANVHAIVNQIGSGSTSNLSITDNCLDNISHSGLTEYSASGIGILQSVSTGTLVGLTIARNQINNVNVNTGNWPTGKIAYGIQINVGGGSAYLTNGKVLDANVNSNIISNLTGFIATGIALEGNTEDAVVANNDVSLLTGNKPGTRAGGGYDLQALKFESNRYVQTCTIENNAFRANTFTHGTGGAGVGYAVANYVPVGGTYNGGTTGAATLGCNWLGSDDPEVLADNATFTGKIFNKDGCLTHFLPALASGTDTDINTPGFQPATGTCTVEGPVSIGGTQYATLQQALDAANDGDVITVLAGGTYGGVTFNNPGETVTLTTASGVSVTIVGASPALTVTAGDLIVQNGISFTTSTDDPTILVNGGSLTMTNCTITESTAFNQTGVMVTGGTVNLGTLGTPGHNTFITDGTGKAVTNNSTTAVNAIGNYWGTMEPAEIVTKIAGTGTVNWQPWCNDDFTVCDNYDYAPVTSFGTPVEVSCGVWDFPVVVTYFQHIGAISLVLNYDDAVLQYQSVTLNTAISGAISANPVAGTFTLAQFPSPDVSLADGSVLFTLRFSLLPAAAGTAPALVWSTTPQDCEYGAANGAYVYTSTFNNLSGWTLPVRPVKNTTTGYEYCTIQEGIDDAATLNGHTITVAAGTYAENVTVYKRLSILGTGMVTTIIDGSVVINAGDDPTQRVTLKDISVLATTGSLVGDTWFGIRLDGTSADLAPVTLENVKARGRNIGNFVYGTGILITPNGNAIDDVDILNCEITDNYTHGLFLKNTNGSATGAFSNLLLQNTPVDNNSAKPAGAGGDRIGFYVMQTNANPNILVDEILIENCSFNNHVKGIYAEAANDIYFKNVTASGNTKEGIDLNLKFRNYQNITFDGCTFTGNGTAFDAPNLHIKGRNDGATYGANPASITNIDFIGGVYNSNAIGDPGISIGNNVSDISFSSGASFTGTSGLGLVLYTSTATPDVLLGNSSFAGTLNGYIANTSALSVDATSATFNGKTGSASTLAENFTIEDKILHKIDVGSFGFVKVNDLSTYVTPNSFLAPATTTPSIQRGIDAASNGWTVNVNDGVYFENVNVNKEVTVDGYSQAGVIVYPVISAPNPGGGGSIQPGSSNLFLVQANNVTIKDLTADGNNTSLTSGVLSNGVDVDARNGIITDHTTGSFTNLTVQNVKVQNIYLRGIYCSTTGGNFNFSNNIVTNAAGDPASVAIMGWASTGTISGNTVSNSNDGIALNHSKGVTISGNTVAGCGSGIHTDNNGSGGTGIADIISNNTVSNCGYGIFVFAPYLNVSVDGNTVTNSDVGLTSAGTYGTAAPTFTNNVVDGTGKANSYGVYSTTEIWGYLSGNQYASFTNNYIQNTTNAFLLCSQSGFTNNTSANNNSITGNTLGVKLADDYTEIPPTGTFSLSMTCNWWGTTSVSGVETAVGSTNPAIIYDPWLVDGTDNDVVIGFQPVPNSCIGAANLYVNDGVLNGDDIYTTAIGVDANAGTAAAPFLTITKAVNTAVDGTQIWVDAGTFQEQVFIGKTVDITGVDYTKTTVKAPVTMQTAPISIWSTNEAVNPIIYAFDNTKTINLSKLTVDGDGGRTLNKYFGVLFYEANGTFSYGKITGIRDAGSFSGAQAGIAYYGGHIRTSTLSQNLTFTNNIVDDFQKGGVVVDAPGTIGIIDNNTITGQNVPLVTAQNGIQLSRGASGSIQGNTISNCIWNKVEHPHQYTAAGILLYQAGATTVSGNTLSGNELALSSYGSSGLTYGVNTFSNNKIHLWLDAASDINAGNVYDKYVLDATTNPEAVFGCIQYAIDEATAGDVLNASAGTFDEMLNVHTLVDLRGPNYNIHPVTGTRVPEAIITYPAGVSGYNELVAIGPWDSRADVDGVSINGFTLDGNPLAGGEATGIMGNGDNLVVKNNIIKNFNDVALWVTSYVYENNAWTYDDYNNSLLVQDNHFLNPDIYAGMVSNNNGFGIYLQGTYGTITGNLVEDMKSGIQVQPYNHPNSTNGVGTVSANTFEGFRDAMWFNYAENANSDWMFSGNTGTGIAPPAAITEAEWRGFRISTNYQGNLDFTNNTITAGSAVATDIHGIKFQIPSTASVVNILDNSITGAQYGVYIPTGTLNLASITIEDNTIASNTLYGVYNGTATPVDASPNWWGDASGPYHATLNPCGLGNAVTDNVDFSPWYFQSGMTTLNGLSPVAVTTTENVSTVTATPVVFNTTVEYGSDITNYDPAILADARITSNPAFPTGAQVIGVKYNGTDVLPAAYSLTGTQAYLSDILAGSPYPLNQHNNVTDVWEVIVAGFNSDQTYAISMDAVSYTGAETNCNTVRGSDAFNVTFAPVDFTYTPETPVCELNPVNVPYTETYPLVENNGGNRVLNDSKWEFYTDAGMTTPFALPIGTKITVGQVNGLGAFTWSSTSTLTTAVSSLYGSAVVTGQGNPSTYDYGQLVALTRPAVTNDWMAILEGVPAGTYYVKVKNLAMLDPDGLQYVPTWPHGTFTEFVYDEQSFQVVINDCGISGVLTYYNNAASLLKNVQISLYQNGSPVLDGSSNPIVSTTDGTTAAYTFPGLPAGTYELRPAKTDEVRSINATDAAQVNYWQVNAPTVYAIEKVRFLAGDVDRSTPNGTPFTTVSNSYLTSSDASRILQYFVSAGNPTWAYANAWSFWKAGDMQSDKGWLESAFPNLEITNAPLTNQTLYGMVTGDFNRSWTSSSKGQGMNLSLQEGQNVQVAASTEVLLPVTAGMPMEVGAISLILNYPDDKVTVEAVYLGNNPNQPLLFSAANGVLRIGWTSAMSVYLNTGETLLTLKLRTASVLGNNELIRFVLDGDPLNELADGDGIVVPNALLTADNLVTSLTGLDDLSGNGLMIRNYPNPFSEQTTFVYYLPTSGKVSLEVFDVTGRMVTEVTEANASAGSHTYTLEAGSLTPGIYTARLSFTAGGKALTRTLKLILQD
jgi:parallel beta-helix repeat protein